ncbi:MAG: hypothetical protein IBJ18_04365 [Phycisphaerales bacterium]|nr:hypothetical protein [Phycisphaerales bacterium]
MNARRGIRFVPRPWCALAFALALCPPFHTLAHADTIPSASSPRVIRADEGLRSAHAWFVVPAADGQTAALMHMPPRDGLGFTGPGTARRVAEMPFIPDALAASGETVYIIRPVELTDVEKNKTIKQRRVLSFRARPMSQGFWDFEPPAGRVEPKLPGDGELIDAIGAAQGPAVLLGPVAGAPGDASSWRFFSLLQGEWESLTLTQQSLSTPTAPSPGEPAQSAPEFSHLRLTAVSSRGPDAGEPRLIVQRQGVRDYAEIWRITRTPVQASPTGKDDPNTESHTTIWRFEPAGRIALPPDNAIDSLTFRWIDQRVIASAFRQDTLTVWALDADRATELNRVTGLGPQHAAIGLTGLSRLSVVWVEPASTAASTQESSKPTNAIPAGPRTPATALARRELKFVEVSTLNGAELFVGGAKREGPLTKNDLGTLAMIISAMTAVVLLFVLRADNTNVVRLPKGYSLAAPARRFVAAMIDFLPGYVIAVWSMGVSLLQLLVSGFGPSGLSTVSTSSGMDALTSAAMLIAASLVGAAAHCTVGEWLLGRSLGKLLTGCEVISVAVPVRPKKAPSTGTTQTENQPTTSTSSDEAAPTSSVSTTVQRITLWQAALRNAVRWIPPLAILVVLDTNFRHPGDVLASTVVVIPPEPEETDDDREDDVR